MVKNENNFKVFFSFLLSAFCDHRREVFGPTCKHYQLTIVLAGGWGSKFKRGCVWPGGFERCYPLMVDRLVVGRCLLFYNNNATSDFDIHSGSGGNRFINRIGITLNAEHYCLLTRE